MLSLELETAKLANTESRDGCVLPIVAAHNDATRILDSLGSATNERFRMKRVTEVSSGIERSRRGRVAAVVLELTLPDCRGVKTLDRLSESAPRVPTLILSGTEAKEMARQAIRRDARNYLANHHADGCRLRQRCTQ